MGNKSGFNDSCGCGSTESHEILEDEEDIHCEDEEDELCDEDYDILSECVAFFYEHEIPVEELSEIISALGKKNGKEVLQSDMEKDEDGNLIGILIEHSAEDVEEMAFFALTAESLCINAHKDSIEKVRTDVEKILGDKIQFVGSNVFSDVLDGIENDEITLS